MEADDDDEEEADGKEEEDKEKDAKEVKKEEGEMEKETPVEQQAEEDEVDPLDAYMEEVKQEVKKFNIGPMKGNDKVRASLLIKVELRVAFFLYSVKNICKGVFSHETCYKSTLNHFDV